MSQSAIRAGKAFYELTAEDKTGKGLASAEARLKAFGARITMIGAAMTGFAAAGITAVGAMVKTFAGIGDTLSNAMSQTGLSSDFLQTLKLGAEAAGVPFQALLAGMNKYQKIITDAASGSEQAQATLAKLGLTVHDLAGLSPDEQFAKLADAINGIDDPAERAAAAMSVFGEAGARMLPMLENGAAGLAEQMEDLKKRGRIMSPEDLELAIKAQGAFNQLKNGLSRVVELIAAAVAPTFITLAKAFDQALDGIIKFIDNNRELVAGVVVGIGVIGAAGLALMGLGAAFSLIGSLGTVFTALGVVIGAILSPVGLIVAAIVACGAAALVSAYYLDQLFNGGAALKFLQDMASGAMLAMRALWTAISNGRWDLAGQLIMDGLALAFASGLAALSDGWASFAVWLVSSMVDAMRGVVSAVTAGMSSALAALQVAAGTLGVDALIPGLDAAMRGVQGVGAGVNVLGDGLVAGLETNASATAAANAADIARLTAQLGATFAAIADVDEKRQAERKKKKPKDDIEFRPEVAMVSGATSSSAAALLGRTGGGNSIGERQLAVQQDMFAVLKDILGGVEDFNVLSAD